MSKINEFLYIGSKNEASDLVWLREHGITHIVNCAIELPNYHAGQGIKYKSLKLNDNHHQSIHHILEPIHNFIRKTTASKNKVLVHCAAGKSRSAAVVIYHMMKTYNLPFYDALDLLKQVRPIVRPNIGFRQQLIEMEFTTRKPCRHNYNLRSQSLMKILKEKSLCANND